MLRAGGETGHGQHVELHVLGRTAICRVEEYEQLTKRGML
jgi:hypothetical protein